MRERNTEGFLILKKKRERESFLFLLLACDSERKLAKMAAKEEDGNVKADGDPAKQRERDQLLEEIFSNHLLSPGFFLFRSSSSSFTMLFRYLCIYLVHFLQDHSVFASELSLLVHQVDF